MIRGEDGGGGVGGWGGGAGKPRPPPWMGPEPFSAARDSPRSALHPSPQPHSADTLSSLVASKGTEHFSCFLLEVSASYFCSGIEEFLPTLLKI